MSHHEINADKQTVVRAKGHEDDVNAVAFAERDNSNVFASGSDDLYVKVRLHALHLWLLHSISCRCGTGDSFPAGGRCLLVSLWAILRVSLTLTVRYLPVWLKARAVMLQPRVTQMDGRYLISNGKDQTTKLWDMRNMVAPSRIDERYRGVPSYTFSGWCAGMRP